MRPSRWCGGPSPGSSRCSSRAAAGARSAAATTTRRWPARATPTASQTAWALLGLIAAGEADSDDRPRRRRLPASPPSSDDGNWHETPFTGTGFPKVFYLKYHMYSLYFPLMAPGKQLSAMTRSAHSALRG